MGKRFTPPRALRRPLTSIQHGITRTDDYSWLRASDWHAVLRNPDALPSDIRAHLEPKMLTHQPSWLTARHCASNSSPR